jgi:hypothetical protein
MHQRLIIQQQRALLLPRMRTESFCIHSDKVYLLIGRQAANDGHAFMFGGRGRTPDDFISVLGEPINKEACRWYFEQDVQIDVFTDNTEIGNYVFLGSQCELKTAEGIGIGSTYDEVMEAYKDEINPEQTNKDIITVGINDEGVFFVIDEGVVSSIYISTSDMTPEYWGEFVPDR